VHLLQVRPYWGITVDYDFIIHKCSLISVFNTIISFYQRWSSHLNLQLAKAWTMLEAKYYSIHIPNYIQLSAVALLSTYSFAIWFPTLFGVFILEESPYAGLWVNYCHLQIMMHQKDSASIKKERLYYGYNGPKVIGWFLLQVKETPIKMLCETNRTILTVNGLFPGPEIRARKGDTIYVNVTNTGPYGITIHW